MRWAVLCLVIWSLATTFAHAQIPFRDLEFKSEAELNTLLQETKHADQGRIHSLLGRQILDRDPALARQHLVQANLTLVPDDVAGRAYLDANWCWLHIATGEIADAREACSRSRQLAETVQDPWVMTKAYGAEAVLHYQRGELQSAHQFGVQAVKASRLVGRPQIIAAQYNAMGLISRAQGLYQTSLNYFAGGLELLDAVADEELSYVLSFNVGIAYADLGQHKVAKEFYRGTLNWAQDTRRYSKELTAFIYMSISDIALGQAQLARERLEAAFERPELAENSGYLGFAYAVLGESLLALERFDLALVAYEKGMDIAAANPNTFEQRRLKTGYARALFNTDQISRARILVGEAIAQLRRENARQMLLASLDLLSELEEAEGNYAASLAANRESTELARDFQRQTLELLAELRSDFELDEKERELAQAEQAMIIRNGVIMLVLAFAFIGYLGVTRRIQKHRAEAEAHHAGRLERVVAERTKELQEKIAQADIAESARIALERQLAEAEKLRVLGQLTGGVAHDFNNLLTVVTGATELLRADLDDEERYSGLIDHILAASSSGADITRALMAYARKQPLQLERVELREVLAERIPLVGRALGGMVRLRLDVNDCPELQVVLDLSQLTTALLNLALNARDAQDNLGEIVVALSKRDSKWAVISVSDTGCGMTTEQVSRAVEPFYTTKTESHGNGLGLSMVYGFSKQIGGDLEIESEPDVGTQIRIVLPLAHLADTRVTEVDFGAS